MSFLPGLTDLFGGKKAPENPAYKDQSPFLRDAYGKAQGLYNSGAGATPSWITDMYQQFGQGGYQNPAQQLTRNTASGNFLNSNPYLDKMFDQASDAVTRQYTNTAIPAIRSNFGMAGGYNRGSEAGATNNANYSLGQNLNNLATNIYGGNYANERQNMEMAQGRLGNIYDQGINTQFQAVGQSRDIANDPWRRLQQYSSVIGSPQQPLTGQQRGNPFMSALGGAALGASIPGIGPLIGGGIGLLGGM